MNKPKVPEWQMEIRRRLAASLANKEEYTCPCCKRVMPHGTAVYYNARYDFAICRDCYR